MCLCFLLQGVQVFLLFVLDGVLIIVIVLVSVVVLIVLVVLGRVLVVLGLLGVVLVSYLALFLAQGLTCHEVVGLVHGVGLIHVIVFLVLA